MAIRISLILALVATTSTACIDNADGEDGRPEADADTDSDTDADTDSDTEDDGVVEIFLTTDFATTDRTGKGQLVWVQVYAWNVTTNDQSRWFVDGQEVIDGAVNLSDDDDDLSGWFAATDTDTIELGGFAWFDYDGDGNGDREDWLVYGPAQTDTYASAYIVGGDQECVVVPNGASGGGDIECGYNHDW